MKFTARIRAAINAFRRTPQTWYPITAMPTRANIIVTPDQALRLSAVIACVRVISESLSTLPLHIYRRISDTQREPARDHPLTPLLTRRPNSWQTPVDFFDYMQGALCLRGNAYAQIVYDPRDQPTDLLPINPDRVRIERQNDGLLRYMVRTDGREQVILQSDMLHVRGFSNDGVAGLSPIAQAAESIGISLAAERLSAAFFRQGTVLNVALEHPGNLTPQAHKNLKDSIQQEYGGADNAYKPYILEEGMKWHDIGVKPEEGQFLETRKFHITDICRIFRVPPHMVADLEKATFSNIEHQALEFVTNSLMPWAVRWEQAISRDLIREDDQDHFARFVMDGLLRGDTKARSEALAIQFQNGVISQNEWRALENRNPIENGDRYYVPLNMTDSAGADDAQVDQGAVDDSALAGWIESTTDRIVKAETRAVERWLSRAAHSKPWSEWIADFYSKHMLYVQDAVRPIADMFDRTGTVPNLASKVCDQAIDQYSQMTPAAARAHIQHCRYRQLRDAIIEWVPEAKQCFS